MIEYAETLGCRMEYIGRLLDDPEASRCGICDRCAGPSFASDIDGGLERQAAIFLAHRPSPIEPRKQWPAGHPSVSGRIPLDEQLEPGWALSRWGRGPLAELVRDGKQVDGVFEDELVAASADFIRRTWAPNPPPGWVAWVPSLRHPELVADFATRLARALSLPAAVAVEKTTDTSQQKHMQNSAQQVSNVLRAFRIATPLPPGPVLLVDDIVDSRWTLTIVGRLLRLAGVPAVYPFALADTAGSSQ